MKRNKKYFDLEHRQYWSNIANKITLNRLKIGAPLIIILTILLSLGVLTALPVAIFLSVFFLTDVIDGMIAKINNASTIKGQLLDQGCDKAFGAITLTLAAIFANIYAIIPIIGELSIFISSQKNTKSDESSLIGKVKMFPLALFTIVSFLGVSYPMFKETIEPLGVSITDLLLKITILCQAGTLGTYLINNKKTEEDEYDPKKDIELEELFKTDPELQKIKRKKNGYISFKNTFEFARKHQDTLGSIEFNDMIGKERNIMKLIKTIKKYENNNKHI